MGTVTTIKLAESWDNVQVNLVFKYNLTLMLLVANLAVTNDAKNLKNDWNPGTWYSSKSTQWELSNKYQHDKV